MVRGPISSKSGWTRKYWSRCVPNHRCPMTSSTSKASAAALTVRRVGLSRGIEERSGNRDCLVHCKVSRDVPEIFLFSQFGSRSLTQICRSIGISFGSCDLALMEEWLNFTTCAATGSRRVFLTVMVALSLRAEIERGEPRMVPKVGCLWSPQCSSDKGSGAVCRLGGCSLPV